MSDYFPYILLGLFALFVGIVIFVNRGKVDDGSTEEEMLLDSDSSQNPEVKNITPIYCTDFVHVNGLPIAENLPCTLTIYSDRVEFQSGAITIKLMRSKITDVCVRTDTEVLTQPVSSAGRAIAGAILFGALGAVIGGRVKNKKTKTVSYYLIITYIADQNEIKYIGFDVSNNVFAANKLVKSLGGAEGVQRVEIEL